MFASTNPTLFMIGWISRCHLGTTGDNLDRYHVRMQEMEQSLRIAEQALETLPEGPINVDHEGREIEAHELVDLAKMGLTRGVKETLVQLSPNLEGLEGPGTTRSQPRKTCRPPRQEDTYGNIEGS